VKNCRILGDEDAIEWEYTIPEAKATLWRHLEYSFNVSSLQVLFLNISVIMLTLYNGAIYNSAQYI
jgi:hypothetical protein